MAEPDIQRLLSSIVAWAEDAPAVQALALVGSWARGDAGRSSDVDLVLIAADPLTLIQDQSWAERFGTVIRMGLEDWGKVTSLRVWYQDSFEVEFGIASLDWGAEPLDPGARRVMGGGFRALVDKCGYFGGAGGGSPNRAIIEDPE